MRPGLRERFQCAVRGLTPGYFALVMGSGILSVGTRATGHGTVSVLLLMVAAASFTVLVALNGWRLLAYRDAVAEDFTDASRSFNFFTLVAGTNVLGVRAAMDGHHTITATLIVLGGLLWLVLGYLIPWKVVFGASRRPVVADADGTWFIWVVASQSVAVSLVSLASVFSATGDLLSVVAVFAWSVGVILYATAGGLVVTRMMLYELRPEDLTPPYWVAMGASAITALAGARIVAMADAPMVDATRDFIAGAAVVFWAFATWLIPVLVTVGWWRHVTHRVPVSYEATWWSVIFPLGMYAVAGIYLGRADDLPLVADIGSIELWVAVAAWMTAMAAMTVHLARTVLLPPRPVSSSPQSR